MDCKQHITDKHVTPSKSGILKIPLSKGVATDSPYRNLPSFSTPPSRFSKILNPFESHLLDRLHLPTFRYVFTILSLSQLFSKHNF